MAINWKNRLKNKSVLTGLIATTALLGNQVALLFGVDYSAQIEQLVNIAGTVLVLLSGLGVVVDANSKGIKDTGIALEYTEPRDENKNPVQFISGVQGSKALGGAPVVDVDESENNGNI